MRVSARVALVVSLLGLLLLCAGTTTAGYLIEGHRQHADRDHRLAAAAAYVEHAATRAESKRWQRSLTDKLAALGLSARLTIVSPTSKRSIYQPRSKSSSNA